MKMVSLKQPCNQIQEISCVPNTPNTMANGIGALVRRRDGDTSAMWMVDKGICNDRKQGLGFILSLVQVLSTIIT